MARVSKKVSVAQREAENAQHRIWKTAIYARLSDFDDVLRDTEWKACWDAAEGYLPVFGRWSMRVLIYVTVGS